MKLNLGSQNKIKIQAVTNAVAQYPNLFPNPEVVGIVPKVDIFGHPKSLQETVQGAINRAKDAFVDCEYSFGLEDGIMEVPGSQTGHMNVCACAIWNGSEIAVGLSPAFEYPQKVLDLIQSGKADGSQAFKMAGLTEHEKLGTQDGGIIGLLTEGRMMREQYSEYAIIAALVRFDKKEWF